MAFFWMLLPGALKLILVIICVLLSVAFLTLFEQKVLSYYQKRKGPNKWGVKGILQPFTDAIKLFIKETILPSLSNILVFGVSPTIVLFISLVLWLAYPTSFGNMEINLPIIFVFCCLTVSVYPILGAGWASNSKYSLLGSLRAVAQTISYEVSLAIIILSLVVLNCSYTLNEFFNPKNCVFLLVAPALGGLWFISALAETSRTPFDFSEGESELVSGFNTEFSSGGFILFFLAEYSSILFMSFLFSILFLNPYDPSFVLSVLVLVLAYLFLWVRGTLPRLRYDKLMNLAWKVFLPVALMHLLASMSVATWVEMTTI